MPLLTRELIVEGPGNKTDTIRRSATVFSLHTSAAARFLGITPEELSTLRISGMRLNRADDNFHLGYTDNALFEIAKFLCDHPLPEELGKGKISMSVNPRTGIAKVQYTEYSQDSGMIMRQMTLKLSSQPQA